MKSCFTIVLCVLRLVSHLSPTLSPPYCLRYKCRGKKSKPCDRVASENVVCLSWRSQLQWINICQHQELVWPETCMQTLQWGPGNSLFRVTPLQVDRRHEPRDREPVERDGLKTLEAPHSMVSKPGKSPVICEFWDPSSYHHINRIISHFFVTVCDIIVAPGFRKAAGSLEGRKDGTPSTPWGCHVQQVDGTGSDRIMEKRLELTGDACLSPEQF